MRTSDRTTAARIESLRKRRLQHQALLKKQKQQADHAKQLRQLQHTELIKRQRLAAAQRRLKRQTKHAIKLQHQTEAAAKARDERLRQHAERVKRESEAAAVRRALRRERHEEMLRMQAMEKKQSRRAKANATTEPVIKGERVKDNVERDGTGHPLSIATTTKATTPPPSPTAP